MSKITDMKQATQFPCCLHDARLNTVDLGDDGLPLVVDRGNIKEWLGYIETSIPENADSLSDVELIAFLAESYKSSREIISYKDALQFSNPRAIEILKELALKGQGLCDYRAEYPWGLCGDFYRYEPELKEIVMEFSMGLLNREPDPAI